MTLNKLITVSLLLLPVSFLLINPAFSSDSAGFWLGKLPAAPTEKCATGTIYYDTGLSRLKKCSVPVTTWKNLPGESAYSRFVTVGESAEADFTVADHGLACLQKAIDSLKGSTKEKRSAIIIFPGKYHLGKKALVCAEYIDLIGIDHSKCTVSGNGKTIINIANNCGIMNLSIDNLNKSGNSKTLVCKKISSFSYVTSCSIKSHGTAVYCTGSPSFNLTSCAIKGLKKYGVLCRKSNATIFNSTVSGRLFALSCLGSSTATLFNSTVKGIYISKKSTVEMNNSNTAGLTIDGKSGAILIMEPTDFYIPVAPEIRRKAPYAAKFAMKKNINSSHFAKSHPKKKKNCSSCKKKRGNVYEIGIDEVYKKLFVRNNKNVILIDVRSKRSYEMKHIKKAINLPAVKIRDGLSEISKNKEIIVYCSSRKCRVSEEMARTLMFLGYSRVLDMKGGFSEWEEKGYPIVVKRLNTKKK